MANKPHVKLNWKKQSEGSVKMSFNYGFGDKKEESKEEPNYDLMIESFRTSLVHYSRDKEKRITLDFKHNKTIEASSMVL